MEYVSDIIYIISSMCILLLLTTTHKRVKQIETNVDYVRIKLKLDDDLSESESEASEEYEESEASEEYEVKTPEVKTRNRSQSI